MSKIYLDVNKKQIKKGHVVRIFDAYAKGDNGLFLVKHTPQCEEYYSRLYLEKLNSKNFDPSVAKYSNISWPLVSYSNNRDYKIKSRLHNEANCKIEIIGIYEELKKIKDIELLEREKIKKQKGKTKKTITELKGVKTGDIFSTSWGYEQTNVDFYQVTELRGKSTVILKEIGHRTVEDTSWCSSEVVPVKDSFLNDEVITKRIQNHDKQKNPYLSFEFSIARKHTEGQTYYKSWGY